MFDEVNILRLSEYVNNFFYSVILNLMTQRHGLAVAGS